MLIFWPGTCVEFVLLGANYDTRTKAEVDLVFFFVLTFLEVANSYPNGFVTETRSKMCMKNRGEEMDQKREVKKMAVQKERKIDK